MYLELKNISKNFGKKKVLDDISFCAKSGKAFGILGRNGAGKTTTIRIIMDILKFDSGQVLINNQSIDYKKIKIGYLPEEKGLYPKNKIIDQLVYLLELRGIKHREAKALSEYWLQRLEMIEYRNKKLETLSKGNQQKIQLITALMHDPDIIILDEPFSGLDPVNAIILKSIVRDEIEKGKIVLFSSHQMNYIEEFCDEIAILHNGKSILSGNINTIKRSYARDTIAIKSNFINRIKESLKDKCLEVNSNEIHVKLESESQKQEAMAYIIKNFEIDSISIYEPTLNDIFVEYTKESKVK